MYQRGRAPVHYLTPNEWLGGKTKTKFNIVMIIITTVVTWKRATCVPGYRVARLEFKGFAQCFATCPYPRNSWHRDSRRKAWFLDHKSVAACPFFPHKKQGWQSHLKSQLVLSEGFSPFPAVSSSSKHVCLAAGSDTIATRLLIPSFPPVLGMPCRYFWRSHCAGLVV